jgi:hypothetical protein
VVQNVNYEIEFGVIKSSLAISRVNNGLKTNVLDTFSASIIKVDIETAPDGGDI